MKPWSATPRVSTPARFTLIYEAGPYGVASGGSVFLQVSPFWGWSTPQVELSDAPGYTIVRSDAPDVVLEARTLDEQLLGIENAGRPLAPGERIFIDYGAGPDGAA